MKSAQRRAVDQHQANRELLRSRRVEHGLVVVPVGIEGERGVVVARVLRTHAGWPDVRSAVPHGGVVPASDRVRVLSTEGEVRAGGYAVATGLAAHGVQAEGVTGAAPDQGAAVDPELPPR